MKLLKIGMITLFLGSTVPFASIANAEVLKNPVDLTPTAVQNSGASYGPNVVIGRSRSMSQNTDPNTITTETVVTQTDSSADLTYDQLNSQDPALALPADNYSRQAVSERRVDSSIGFNTNPPSDTVITNNVPDQQAQQVEPMNSRGGFWFVTALAFLIIGGIVYSVRRGNQDRSMKI